MSEQTPVSGGPSAGGDPAPDPTEPEGEGPQPEDGPEGLDLDAYTPDGSPDVNPDA